MKICIIGDGLVSLILAKVIARKALSVDIFFNGNSIKYSQTRTIGITKSNINYLNKNDINIEKILWGINQIKIYTENFKKSEILNFSNSNEQAFSIVKNAEFYNILKKDLIYDKFIKFKKNKDYKKIIKDNYNLIINCDLNNQISKKFFSKTIKKNYHSSAYTTIINHKKLIKNNIASQIFTNNGPIAFLPISKTQTSVVYSFKIKQSKNMIDIKRLIHKFNPCYDIIKIGDISKFELKSSNLRNYHKDNILAFGDLLHKVHPLAGQGFNMSLRDIMCLSKLIDEKLDLGLDLDLTICRDFEKETRDKNFIFSMGIDLIYEFFYFESKTNNELISKSLSILGKNKFFNSFFKKFADSGLRA
tara:strand:- start:1148 stop:2230 length:1083 start_codon:yes stop_codon:yes gene_type:complete